MTKLRDMEELLQNVTSLQIKSYMEEALECYSIGAHRGAILMITIALFEHLYNRLEVLSHSNNNAKTIYNEVKKRRKNQDVYESYLIDQLTSKNLIAQLDSDILSVIRNLRNKSAHPSGHIPTAEETRYLYSEVIDRFLSQDIPSSINMVDEIISRIKNELFFPTNTYEDHVKIVEEEILNLDPSAFPKLVISLVNKLDSLDDQEQKNANNFLIGLAGLKRDDLRTVIAKYAFNKIVEDKTKRSFVAAIIFSDGEIINFTTKSANKRLPSFLTQHIKETGTFEVDPIV